MKKALVVGINEYPKIPLSGCINDARDIVRILEKMRMEVETLMESLIEGYLHNLYPSVHLYI